MKKAFTHPFAVRPVRAALAAALASLGAACTAPGFGPPEATAASAPPRTPAFIAALKSARLIDLSHTWEIESPVASVNPPYSFALSATHGKTRGTFNDNGQLSFAAETMQWSGQHGAPSIDAIGHIGREGRLFGGVDAERATAQPQGIGASGVGAHLGIDQFPNELMVNRGVLLDAAGVVMNCAAPLPPDVEITAAHLEQAASREGVRLQPGDTVFIRTGWGPLFKADAAKYAGESSPGPGLDAAEF